MALDHQWFVPSSHDFPDPEVMASGQGLQYLTRPHRRTLTAHGLLGQPRDHTAVAGWLSAWARLFCITDSTTDWWKGQAGLSLIHI